LTQIREHILKAVREFPDRLDRKALARRLDIRGEDRRELRKILRDMIDDGTLILSSKKMYRQAGALPSVMVIRVTGLDDHGDMIGIPEPFKGSGEPPKLIIREGGASKSRKAHRSATIGIGSRALCRIKDKNGRLEASVLKKLGNGPSQRLGVLYKDGRGWSIKPVEKKSRDEFRPSNIPEGIENNSLIMFSSFGGRKGKYDRTAKIDAVIGPADGPKAASLISLRAHDIPVGFSDEVIAQAQSLTLPKLSKYREDLRRIPLITIDPVDAKDFDDAVFAAPDETPQNKEGWVIWVAIADVAAFVTPNSALDNTAREKGNSVYLPDRVEPMLPHELSSNLCSLRPHEDRACLAVMMRFDKTGRKIDHVFKRGIMRSHARLTYGQAQESFDGHPGKAAQPVSHILDDIYAAYKILRKARQDRAPLEIELPERRVHINKAGDVEKITLRDRFDAHKLIEEFMVQANVAAAEALSEKNTISIIRVHEPPARDKLQSLSDFLPAIGLKFSMGDRASTLRFNTLMKQAREKDLTEAVSLSILRSQSQAYYDTDPKGHFGLNLTHYAHFTSPIRRYADLVVHRALITAFNLGEDGTTQTEQSRLKEISEHISSTERRAMAAERDAKDRYIARYLEKNIGATFDARISGVTKFGLFIALDETGADGLIPARELGQEFYVFDEKSKSLIGAQSGDTYRFGRKVKVRLKEADGLTGSLIFEILTKPEAGKPPRRNRGYYPKGRKQYKRGKR